MVPIAYSPSSAVCACMLLAWASLRWVAAEARVKYPEEFRAWREDPANFQVDGVYPVRRLWDQAREAWTEILSQQVLCCSVHSFSEVDSVQSSTVSGMGESSSSLG